MYKAKENCLARLGSWGKAYPSIKSMYLLNPDSFNIDDPGSDLNLLVEIDQDHDVTSLNDSLRKAFENEIVLAFIVPSNITSEMISIRFLNSPRCNLHFTTSRDARELLQIWAPGTKSLIERPDSTLLDATKPISGVSIRHAVKNNISIILNDFELAAIAHYHSDYLGYYAIFYPLLLKTLRLQGMISGNIIGNGNTKHLLNAVMAEPEQKYFTSFLLESNFNEANVARQNYMDWFFSLIEDVNEKFGEQALPGSLKTIINFCEQIHERYYLRNFRPVQGTNKVFRSLAPASYKNDPRLEHWMIENNIKTIIDLRRLDEIEKAPDDENLAIKLGQSIHLLNFNADDISASDYTKGLIGCKDEVRMMFETMLASPGSTLLHCGAGKDRTGITVGLVELLLGIPEQRIIAAYLLSGQDTREERIKTSLAYIRDQGGISAYLASCGVSFDLQRQFINKFGVA